MFAYSSSCLSGCFCIWELTLLIFCRMQENTTPLMVALQSNWKEAVVKLLDRGADPNIMKENNILALHFAIEFCADDCECSCRWVDLQAFNFIYLFFNVFLLSDGYSKWIVTHIYLHTVLSHWRFMPSSIVLVFIHCLATSFKALS